MFAKGSAAEKKFNGRARLYVGNLAPEVTEDQLKEILGQYGVRCSSVGFLLVTVTSVT